MNMKKIMKKIILITLIIMFAYVVKVQAVTIVLDPGHGGKDPGAINSDAGLIEAEINYKIAMYLKEYLEQYNDVEVVLTRKQNELKTLQERADVAFNNQADLLLSLHINSNEKGTKIGCERICDI